MVEVADHHLNRIAASHELLPSIVGAARLLQTDLDHSLITKGDCYVRQPVSVEVRHRDGYGCNSGGMVLLRESHLLCAGGNSTQTSEDHG